MQVKTQFKIQKGATTKWSVVRLREMLHNYISAKENTEQRTGYDGITDNTTGKQTNNVLGYKTFQEPRQQRLTTEALFTGQQPTSYRTKSYRDLCRFCEGRHWTGECDKFRTLDSRKQQLKGCCFRCLRSGHSTNACKMNKTCVYCKRQNHHHMSLCPDRFYINSKRETVHVIGGNQEEDYTAENVLVF
mgnify:FL=1